MHAQDSTLIQKTYVNVVKTGLSTAPDFVVIRIKNLNNGKVKDICTDVSSLYWSLEQDQNNNLKRDIDKYLLTNARSRTFELKDTSSLSRLNFNTYKIRDRGKINMLIQKNHLRDSLKKITKLSEEVSKEYYTYYDARDSILHEIADSISKIRHLTDEETKMIADLHDLYYDRYYTDTAFNKYRTISLQGHQFIKMWNSKIRMFGINYFKIKGEVARLYKKFFTDYYRRFSLSFCHVAFENGIITYIADESGEISFSEVID